jgi:transitional endoplasmic reticulum ATPase
MSPAVITMRAALHASPLDARRGIVRVHPDVLSLLGLRPWEPLELTARRRTGAMVALAEPDVDRSLLFMDELVLANVGARPGDQVTVSTALVAPATSVVLDGLPAPMGRLDVDALRMALLGKIVTTGDSVSLLPQDFARPHEADMPLGKLVTTLAREWGHSWQSWILKVTSASPGGLVRVGMQTAVAAGSSQTATSSTPVSPEGITLADLPALEQQVEVLREWLDLGFHRAELLAKLGARPEVGILVSGPPGSGKGPMVEAVTQAVGAKLFKIWAPALARSEPNDATQSLKSTIAKAKEQSPAVVLIEDVEALAPREDAGPLLSVLLENVASAVRDPRVAVICTTSKPEEVCPDLRRPGLLDHELLVPLPQRAQRQRILETFSRGIPLAPDVRFDELALRTPGFVAADIKALCREAALCAAQRITDAEVETPPAVHHADFVDALDVVRPSAVEQSTLEVADVTLDDVGGMEDVKRQLIETVVWPLTYPETFSRLGVEPSRGVLLYGPPGCGKTHLVKALANEAQANFFAIRGAELLSKWVGESERGVRELFRRARGSAPALIFFDEVDALAPLRGGRDDGAPTDRVVAQLLTELDGIEELQDVFVVGATNRPELIDPALLRPGRLDRLVHVPPPDAASRGDVLRAVTKRMPLGDDVDLDAIGAECDRYSAADLEGLAREAAMNAMRESMAAPVVTAAHFAAARQRVAPSIDPRAVLAAQEWAGRFR